MTPIAIMDSWLDEACQLLGLPDVPGPDLRDRLLELARDVAHGVARPAAPLTTFLLGLAVGATQASDAEVERLVALISAAARRHEPDSALSHGSAGEAASHGSAGEAAE